MQWLPAPELDAFLFRPHLPSVLHGARPAPPPYGASHRPLAAALRALRPDRRAQRERPGHPRRARRREGAAAGHPSPRVSERSGEAGRRAHGARLRDHPAVQGARRRDRGRAAGRATRGCSSRATRWSRSSRTALPRTGSTWSGGSAICRSREIDRAFGGRDGGRLPLPARARPERRSPARARRRSPGGRLRRRRHRGAGSALRGRARGAAPATSARLAEAVHELLSDPAALERARAGARRAREELTWDAAAQAHLALYEEIA